MNPSETPQGPDTPGSSPPPEPPAASGASARPFWSRLPLPEKPWLRWTVLIGVPLLVIFIVLPVFFWIPDHPAPDKLKNLPKAILVDLDKQMLYGYENGVQKHKYFVASGRIGKWTPPGSFRVTRKDADYHSKRYNSPMPHSLFFVEQYGIAIHGTILIPWRWRVNKMLFSTVLGSAGCVGLAKHDARALFEWAPNGVPVEVIGGRPVSPPTGS